MTQTQYVNLAPKCVLNALHFSSATPVKQVNGEFRVNIYAVQIAKIMYVQGKLVLVPRDVSVDFMEVIVCCRAYRDVKLVVNPSLVINVRRTAIVRIHSINVIAQKYIAFVIKVVFAINARYRPGIQKAVGAVPVVQTANIENVIQIQLVSTV